MGQKVKYAINLISKSGQPKTSKINTQKSVNAY